MATLQKGASEKPTASIIIPTFQRPGLAMLLVKNIRQFEPDIQIIIIDQENSSGVIWADVEKYHVTYLTLDRANTSLAKNKGIQTALGEIVIFFDDDCEVTQDTIKKHLETYSQSKNIVGVAGRVINDDDTVPKDTAVDTGQTNFLATKFSMQFWSTKPQSVDFPYGCNMSFKKGALEKINGFDERFPKIFEEIDLAKRVRKHGTIKFVPEALAYHHKAPSGGTRTNDANKDSLVYRYYGFYIAKNVPFPISLITLFLRTRSAASKKNHVIRDLYSGYFSYFFNNMKKTLSRIKHAFNKDPLFIIAFLIISLVIISLRLWKVPEFFSFNFDEEYQASLAYEQVKNFHPIWIGVSASNLNFYLGPGFTYLNALLFKLSNGDPVSLAWFAALFGLVTTFSVYYITQDLFNKKSALLAMAFYGGSAFLNFFDRRFWNPGPVPFFTLWIVYSIIKAKHNPRWFILTSFLVGAAFHVHLALMPLLPLVFYAVLRQWRLIGRKNWIAIAAIYLFVTFPLLVFDIVHNFDNMRAPLDFLLTKGESGPTSIGTVMLHGKVFLGSIGRMWFVRLFTNIQDEQCLGAHCLITPALPTLVGLSLFIFAAFIGKIIKSKKRSLVIIFAAMFLFMLSFSLYPGYAAEYYLLGFFALFTIAAGVILEAGPRVIVVPLISFFLVANVFTIKTTQQAPFGLLTRKQLITEIMRTIGDKPFSLETYGESERKYHPYGGWRYLFKIYGKTPTQSFADEFFGWIYQDELTGERAKLRVVISDAIPYQSKETPLQMYKRGVYYGYVFTSN